MRQNISTGSKWEPIIGYSRAVVAGNMVFVSGTTATGENGAVVGEGNVYAQSVQALKTIRAALEQAGASLDDVVRTRIYLTDISKWEEAGRAHGEIFGAVRPATTMVEVSSLIAPELLVEIEADAIVSR
jgi:enamine deaminase RidA (YjgF/YER057c/UK114 family)